MTVLCVNCNYLTDGSRCAEPRNISFVTGEPTPRSCDEMRKEDGTCGPEGRLFAGKEPAEPGRL